MTIPKILEVLGCGDPKGSALRELLAYYGIDDNDLTPITDGMADEWLARQRCPCWHEGNYVPGYDSCWGTKEKDPCKCKGDKTKCDFNG